MRWQLGLLILFYIEIAICLTKNSQILRRVVLGILLVFVLEKPVLQLQIKQARVES